MKKILIRAGMSPLVSHSPMDVLSNNLIGNNIGNMLFPHSIARCLMREDTEIHTFVVRDDYSERAMKKIDETYDCLVLPFANAFRVSFVKDLRAVTRLVGNLTIPCIVVGVGAQANLDKMPKNKELADAVKEFMKTILEKSAKVGLRGEFTADYLRSLGFQAERDYTVIGCPSMYLYGGKLPEMKVAELTERSSVSTNSKVQLPQKFHDFMARSWKSLENYYYIPQVLQEIRLMYMGEVMPYDYHQLPGNFPILPDHDIYKEGRGVSFLDVPSWLRFLGEREFSFGSRIHGNIAAILAGTPCFIVVSDQRIRELAEYHRIPHIMMNELTDDTSIFKLHEHADFSGIAKGHAERFAHYLDFLHENGLKTVFDRDATPVETPFDTKLREVFPEPMQLLPYIAMEGRERAGRDREISSLRENYWKMKHYLKRKRRGVDIEG